jgi:cytochrome c oxidase subunit 4
MAEHPHEGQGHGSDAGHAPPAGEHAHPGAKQYLAIAVVLLVLTVIEVAIFYVPQLKSVLVPTLLALSAIKFALVAMFYMHLKFDHRLFSWLFVVPMVLAAALIIALLKLFGVI